MIFDALLVSECVKLIKHSCHGSASRNLDLRIADWSRSGIKHYISRLFGKFLFNRNLLLDALNWSLVRKDVFDGIMSMSRIGYRCLARNIMLWCIDVLLLSLYSVLSLHTLIFWNLLGCALKSKIALDHARLSLFLFGRSLFEVSALDASLETSA